MADTATKDITPTAGIRFSVASRPQRRYSNTQTVSNLSGATSFAPIPLPATGFVRKVGFYFVATLTGASTNAIVAGDGPFNLISGITLTDATGQPIFQPISGYNLYLVNRYFPSGTVKQNQFNPWNDPTVGPEFTNALTSTTGASAKFRLDLDLEQDYDSGYGCIPNLDSNASLQLKIDVAVYTVWATITTPSAATVAVTVDQHYWAPVSASIGGVPARTTPAGFGDFVETRYETQTVSASAENTVAVNNRGGLVKGIIAVSRAAGARVAFTAASNVGLVYDNNAIDEGIKLETHYDQLRRAYGYLGTDRAVTTAFTAPTGGLPAGIDIGVLVWNFAAQSAGRDSWLSTRVGTLLQLKVTPGAAATQLELITQLAQVKDADAFYAGGF